MKDYAFSMTSCHADMCSCSPPRVTCVNCKAQSCMSLLALQVQHSECKVLQLRVRVHRGGYTASSMGVLPGMWLRVDNVLC